MKSSAYFTEGFLLVMRSHHEGIQCFSRYKGFPGGSVVENLPANAGDTGLIPEWGISPGERSGNPLQYSCLGNPMDRGAWRATVYEVTKSRTRLSDQAQSQQLYLFEGQIAPSLVSSSLLNPSDLTPRAFENILRSALMICQLPQPRSGIGHCS